MKSIFFYLIVFTVFCNATNGFSQTVKYHRIEASIDADKFQALMKAGLEIDHYYYQKEHLIAEVSDNDLLIIKQFKVPFTYLINDLEKNYKTHNQKTDKDNANQQLNALTVPTPVNFGLGGSYGNGTGAKHYTFQEMQNELDKMRLLYPGLISVKSSIGTSIQGRDLFVVRISDNPDIDEAEPEVFLNAVHHAREPISMTQLIFFMWHILENYGSDKEITHLINSTELYVLPCVNPDGYVYNQTANNAGGSMWRKNRKPNGDGSFGVDNNRNYGYNWGGSGSSTSTTSDTYRGPAPFSEQENVAVKNFINSRHFVSEFNYHAYGNYCIYPYSYIAVNNNPEVPLFNQLSVFLTEDNGFTYGNAQATVNYVASGCAEDWAYGEQTSKGKMYGFTPEVGNSSDGFYPASSRIIPLCNSMIVMNKNLLKVSTKFAAVTSSLPATVSSLNNTLPFTIKNYSLLAATYTVSINPLVSYVTASDGPKMFSAIPIFQTQSNSFQFTLDSSTPVGAVISFELILDNGLDIRKDTINTTYICAAPVNLATGSITSNSANISWQPLSGISNYYTSYKTAGSSVWSAELLVSGNSSILSGLVSNTAYNWRVRAANCDTYSAANNFTTLTVCGVPAPAVNTITPVAFTLSWPAIATASGYTVQYRQQGNTSWIGSSVTTPSNTITGLSPATAYEYQVRTTCPYGTSAWSAMGTITTAAVTYCSSNGTNNNAEWIDYVGLGTISRTSGKELGGYINTGLTTNLQKGVNYTLTLSAGFSSSTYKEKWRVYVDNNGDGDFGDAGEDLVNISKSGSGSFNVTIKIPNTATAGLTRMRVIMSRNTISSSCGSFSYGEVEDYTINLAATNLVSRNFVEEINTEKKITADWNIKAMPNPFVDIIHVQLTAEFSGTVSFSLINANGVTVYNAIKSSKNSVHDIVTNNLPPGLYLLKIQQGDKIKTLKLIK